MYKFCTSVETLFLDYATFFEKNVFGSKETLDLDISNAHSTLKTCDRYSNCPSLNKFNCFLPKMPQVGGVCKRMFILTTPYANCLRSLQNQTIQSPELQTLVNDFTEDGIAKKCLDLKERSTLMDAFSQECDEEAGRHFKYFLADLKGYYNCSYN
ncbi:hypothetical protein GCK72_025261 [Caenorhabditis remanei]|uniref:DUF19 domain-containing protein n=1 Tax=Caenorhabditis remanei TaxID=31234 RepID=A0A6A5G2F3_CAERE|nr:hypothetical protein GCK72_025261 [Caenorhabditis remanei]KAF1748794.1 hypothetical protein GCK72_025261 [Caenorhabditis remanei]